MEQVVRSLGLVDAQGLLVAIYDTHKPDREEYGNFRAEVGCLVTRLFG